jgi:hypothetical protein
MTTLTGRVSLAALLHEIAEEVQNFVFDPERDREPQSGQPTDIVVADLSHNEEVKRLYWLRDRYNTLSVRNTMAYNFTGGLPEGVSAEEGMVTGVKAGIYDEMFWWLARRAAGETGPAVGMRRGFILVKPDLEATRRLHSGTSGDPLASLLTSALLTSARRGPRGPRGGGGAVN